MKYIFLVLTVLTIQLNAQSSKKEILLIGTFHFDNPGADLAQVKTFDVTDEKTQKELEKISSKISKYNPDKIFVEWEYSKQAKLDSLYRLYIKDQYAAFVQEKYQKIAFYHQNEIFQLAFRTANKSKHTKVYGIDYRQTKFPFDSLMNGIAKAEQVELRKDIEAVMKSYETTENKNRQTMTLTQLLLHLNTEEYRNFDLGSYVSLFNKAGALDNFVGAYLVSEWYKRNLFIYALIQKITESSDKKVMVLLGSGHITVLKEFIKRDKNFKIVELKDIL